MQAQVPLMTRVCSQGSVRPIMHGNMRLEDYIARIGAILVVALLTVAIHGERALAAHCSPLHVSINPEVARLQRQIAANRAFAVKYGCAVGSSFACREIAGRVAQASARLAGLAAAPGRSCVNPSVAEHTPARHPAPVRSTTIVAAVPHAGAKIETRCVRLSDGYHFPTPNSGYNTAGDIEAIAAQCMFICDDPAMEVYRMTGADRNTDEMVSVKTGARYADLSNAGAYRRAVPLKTCDMNRFYKTVLAEAPAGKARVGPAAESEQDVIVALLGDVDLRGTTSVVPDAARKVRIVGAAFLPEE